MLRVRRLSAAAAVAITVGAGLTACSDNRWCEHDATDVRVADRYCEQNTPGYEWESGSSHKSRKSHKSKSHKSKSGSSGSSSGSRSRSRH